MEFSDKFFSPLKFACAMKTAITSVANENNTVPNDIEIAVNDFSTRFLIIYKLFTVTANVIADSTTVKKYTMHPMIKLITNFSSEVCGGLCRMCSMLILKKRS